MLASPSARRRSQVFVGLLFAAALALPARAAETYWQHDPATPGDWAEPLNWTDGVPGSLDNAYINNAGTATVTAGVPDCDDLFIGEHSAESGGVEMTGGHFTPGTVEVGRLGSGSFTQTGGLHSVGDALYLAHGLPAFGSYELRGSGEVASSSLHVGCGGYGTFTQTGGINTVRGSLALGCWSGARGVYGLIGGQLSADREFVGRDTDFGQTGGTGSFGQTGGTNTVAEALYIAYDAGTAGTYQLGGPGELSAPVEYVGHGGRGIFVHTAGTNTVASDLWLGPPWWEPYAGGHGTYLLSGTAQLWAGMEWIAEGSFEQIGGTNTAGAIIVGDTDRPELSGSYIISHGTVNVGGLIVSDTPPFPGPVPGDGSFHIRGAGAEINVWSRLNFGANSKFTAVPGATIHMTGAAFENQSAAPTDLGGLENLTLIFEGGAEDIDPFEAAGEDMGAVPAGWIDNFALGTLQLGGADVGRIQLVDNFDNQPDWEGAEALYVDNLILNAGAEIDLNALNLYYLNGGPPKQYLPGDGNLDGRVDGDDVPEPAMLALLAAGALALVHRTRRRERRSRKKHAARRIMAYRNGLCFALLACAALSAPGRAGDTFWQHDPAAPGDWLEPLNWTAGTPGTADSAYIDNGGTAEVNAGHVEAATLYSGYSATGTIAQTGGTSTLAESLWLGHEAGSQGTYELTGPGQLSAANEYIGHWGTGTFTHTDGTNTVSDRLVLGHNLDAPGTYELSGTGQLSALSEHVGYSEGGAGVFRQSGGSNTVSDVLGVLGRYELSGTGDLVTEWAWLGGTGRFVQTGGIHTTSNYLYIGKEPGDDGTYELEGGSLTGYFEMVGAEGTGTFNQSGGTNTAETVIVGQYTRGDYVHTGGTLRVTDDLFLATELASLGTYTLSGTGEIIAEWTRIGFGGIGQFVQTGGSHTVSNFFYLGSLAGSYGMYHLMDGSLSAHYEMVGGQDVMAMGMFEQSGGTNTAGTILVGVQWDAPGSYSMSGGTVNVGELIVSGLGGGDGSFDIQDAAAQINVSSLLRLGTNCKFTAVPGATIHMTGAAFENQSQSPGDLAGLANLALIFEGGAAAVDDLEVAGEDMGPILAGWTSNFVLGTLQVGGADLGRIRLVSNSENHAPPCLEALYVNNLVFTPGSTIELNSLNLYFLKDGQPQQLFTGDANLDGCVDGLDYNQWSLHYLQPGGWTEGNCNDDEIADGLDYNAWSLNYQAGCEAAAVPEPVTLSLLALGGLAMLRRRRRR